MDYDLIAVMGRGIQPKEEGQPAQRFNDWEPTGTLEMVGEHGEHLPVREPIDKNSPRCLIGGGEFNVEAATYLYMESNANVITFAYGCTRTPALQAAGAPFEGEVMAAEFRRIILRDYNDNTGGALASDILAGTKLLAWTEQEGAPCNSELELRHVFGLALGAGLRSIAVVTVAVHQPRVQLLVDKLRGSGREYLSLDVETLCSETILLQNNPKRAGDIIREFASPAFARTAKREMVGINKLLDPARYGVYGANKPKI